MTSLAERQVQLETNSLEHGVAFFRREQAQRKPSETLSGQQFLRHCLDLLAEAIRAEQNATLNSKRRPKLRIHDVPLISLDAEKLALITLREAFNQMVRRKEGAKRTLARLAREIGEASFFERTLNVKCGNERNVEKLLISRNQNRWNALERARVYAAQANDDWSRNNRDLRLGLELINLAVKHVQLEGRPVFKIDGEVAAVLTINEETLEWLRHLDLQYEKWARPFFLPMLVPPRLWKEMTGGGYLTITNIQLVKKRRGQSSPKLHVSNQKKVFNAVNLLQNTPWCINHSLYRIAATAWAENFRFPGKLSLKPVKLPGRLSDDASSPVIKHHRAERARIHKHNALVAANRQVMKLRLQWGERFLQEDVLYFPYQLDSRGRIYPIPALFHPQADDLGRALLTFRNSKPLGKRGTYWLAVHLANTFGNDKVPFDDRLKWVTKYENEILDSAMDPLNPRRLWLDAKKPWSFLAACIEWKSYLTRGAEFASSIPVSMDGSCNGLQHLSALGRDPIGAAATNLVPCSVPQDIYREVALKVKENVDHDENANIVEAAGWQNIDRSLVKRATMTTPYGVTKTGIREQLLTEHFGPVVSEEEWRSAHYLAGVLQHSIAKVVIKGVEIMSWLKTVTKILANAGRPLRWTLPTGLVAVHEYFAQKERRIKTSDRTLVIYEDEYPRRISVRKQINAIAPNFIHSLDAAHMMLTVDRLAEHGLSNFAMVHDSYGVHACDVDIMGQVLRQEFVAIYKEPVLGRFYEELCDSNPDISTSISLPPVLGNLEIEEVMNSDYFFA